MKKGIPVIFFLLVFHFAFSQTPDSTGVARAGAQYKGGIFKKIFLGTLYRSSWVAPIHVPYLNLDTTYGGLTPHEKGGGRQTTSTTFKAGNGKTYTFRSVDKDPSKALKPGFQQKFFGKLIRQFTPTQQPYAAMPVAFLLDHTTVLHAHPVLYIMPDTPQLGEYQTLLGCMLGMLEEKPKKPDGKPGSFNADDIISSDTLLARLQNGNCGVHIISYARARLFDIWIGDWGRHRGNWTWAGYRRGNKFIYEPIPHDRDHAFSHWNGLLPYLLSRSWSTPNYVNFNYRFHNTRKLGYAARTTDRLFLSSLDKNDWLALVKELQTEMTDAVIDSAVQLFPKEAIPLSGKVIGEKLKSRRAQLEKGIMKFYKIYSKNITLVSNTGNEYFTLAVKKSGDVEITIVPVANSSDTLFHRIFKPSETKRIYITGMKSGNKPEIQGEGNSRIKLYIDGERRKWALK